MRIINRRSDEGRSKTGEADAAAASDSDGGARLSCDEIKRREDEALLARYRRSRSVAMRNRLIERYRCNVEEMARALRVRLPRSVDVQDLIHAGMWGLIQAIENYRVELGPSFVPFMRIRVRGAMLDELRNLDSLPRLYRARIRMRDEAIQRLRGKLDREPSDGELADDLGLSESRLRELFNLRAPISHIANRGDGDRDETQDLDLMGSLADHDQEAPIEAINRRELMEKIESSLQPIEWDVLRMHYLEGMSGKEVARKLRLSASRICQIHGRVLSRLKSRLEHGV